MGLTRRRLTSSETGILVLVGAAAGGASAFIRDSLDGWITFWPALAVSALFVGLVVYVAGRLLLNRR